MFYKKGRSTQPTPRYGTDRTVSIRTSELTVWPSLRSAWGLHPATPVLSWKLRDWGCRGSECESSNHPTKADSLRKPTKKHKNKKIKDANQNQGPVQFYGSTDQMPQDTAKTLSKNNIKKVEEPYKDLPAFPETVWVSLFNKKNYEVSVLLVPDSSRRLPIVCVFDTGTRLIVIQADVLEPSWLDITH